MCARLCLEMAFYWPVLGLVVGPGCVPGVGLVVLGVSVPMPPALEPEVDAPPEDSPGMPEDELPDVDAPPDVPEEESEGMPEEVPEDVPPVLLPLVSEGMEEEVPPLDEPLVPDVPPELVPEPLPEPPPVMPVHAPSSIAHAMGNIHFVIEDSRLDQ